MSDIFRPYEKLVEISIMGKTFLVPERNSLLRAFQFTPDETPPVLLSAGLKLSAYRTQSCVPNLTGESRVRTTPKSIFRVPHY